MKINYDKIIVDTLLRDNYYNNINTVYRHDVVPLTMVRTPFSAILKIKSYFLDNRMAATHYL